MNLTPKKAGRRRKWPRLSNEPLGRRKLHGYVLHFEAGVGEFLFLRAVRPVQGPLLAHGVYHQTQEDQDQGKQGTHHRSHYVNEAVGK